MTISTPPTIETEQRAELIARARRVAHAPVMDPLDASVALLDCANALASTPPQPERAAIVAWLRAKDTVALTSLMALCIERGEHLAPQPEQQVPPPQGEREDYDGEGLKAISRATVDGDIARMRSAAQPVDEGQVTQEDRKAAAAHLGFPNKGVLDGDCDHFRIVQAFRQHRLASRSRALEEAKAAVRESLFPQNDRSDWTAYAEHRAEACEQAEAAIDEITQSSQGGAGK